MKKRPRADGAGARMRLTRRDTGSPCVRIPKSSSLARPWGPAKTPPATTMRDQHRPPRGKTTGPQQHHSHEEIQTPRATYCDACDSREVTTRHTPTQQQDAPKSTSQRCKRNLRSVPERWIRTRRRNRRSGAQVSFLDDPDSPGRTRANRRHRYQATTWPEGLP